MTTRTRKMIGPQNPFSQELHASKYRDDGESYDDYCVRYARATSDGERHFRETLDALRCQRLLPAGRQQRAVGTPHNLTAMNCFGRETPVLTLEHGVVEIGSVVGETVHVLNAAGRWSPVTFRSYGTQGLRTIQLRHGAERYIKTVRATDGHRWFTSEGQEFTTSDWLGLRSRSSLKVLSTNQAPSEFPIIQGEYDAGLLHGIIHGDGTKTDSGTYYVMLFDSKRSLTPLVEEITGRTHTEIFRPDLGRSVDRVGGIASASDLKSVPSARASTPSFLKGFLAGILATDGSIMRSGESRYARVWGSKELVDYLERWLPVIGVQTKCKRMSAAAGEETNLCVRKTDLWEVSISVPSLDPSDVLREDHSESLSERRTERDALSQRWTFVSISETVQEEEVFCCEEAETHAITIFGSLLTGQCYVGGTLVDSMKGIMKELDDSAMTLRMGGGCGWDFSPLRPKKSRVLGLGDGAEASGPVSFMEMWDAMCRTIMSAGARRGAMMGVLNVHHPDIELFIRSKRAPAHTLPLWDAVLDMEDGPAKQMAYNALQTTLPLQGFNISVGCTDEFMEAVKSDGLYDLRFGGQVFRKVRAQDVWGPMMEMNYDWAEPGVLYIDRINQMNPLGYCERISATNPCGEQPLPPNGACLLGSINATKYIRVSEAPMANVTPIRGPGRQYDVDWPQMERDIRIAVRCFDNVIDRTNYPLPEQEREAKQKRRMGVGYTGLANTIETVWGFPYGTDAYIEVQERFGAFLRDVAYDESVNLAIEKGPFPLFDAELWLSSGYAKTLPEPLRDRIRKHGLRNGLLLSIAPTGTISLSADNVSSGLEPVFAVESSRDVKTADGKITVELNDYAFAKYGTVPRTADQVSPREHVRVLASMQKYVDSAISKTCNVYGLKDGEVREGGITFGEFKDLYIEAYDLGAKGCTTFNVNGKRMGMMRAKEPKKEAPVLEAVAGAACTYDPSTGHRSCE